MNAIATPRARPSNETTFAEDSDTNVESKAKRTKLRRGTRSCWECKRRKIKCMFGSAIDDVCAGCQRRDTKCVSQDLPEEESTPVDRYRQMSDRVVKVEAQLEQLIKKVGNGEETRSEDGGFSHMGVVTLASIIGEKILR